MKEDSLGWLAEGSFQNQFDRGCVTFLCQLQQSCHNVFNVIHCQAHRECVPKCRDVLPPPVICRRLIADGKLPVGGSARFYGFSAHENFLLDSMLLIGVKKFLRRIQAAGDPAERPPGRLGGTNFFQENPMFLWFFPHIASFFPMFSALFSDKKLRGSLVATPAAEAVIPEGTTLRILQALVFSKSLSDQRPH
jgi:hypothetical protein